MSLEFGHDAVRNRLNCYELARIEGAVAVGSPQIAFFPG